MQAIIKTGFVILLISLSLDAKSDKLQEFDDDNDASQHSSHRNARILLPPYKNSLDDESVSHEYLEQDKSVKSIGPYPLHPKNKPINRESTVENTKGYDDHNSENEVDDITRKARILWPYPLHPNNATKDNNNKTNDNITNNSSNSSNQQGSDNKRNQRFIFKYSYPQSPIFDVVMKSMAINYNPTNMFDPFDFLRDSYPLPKGYSQPLDEYDYIIVGAGSAGSVLASRLSEKEGTSKPMVLLLEAGKPEMLFTDVPALVPLFQLTDYTWQYSAEPQPGICLGSENQRCFWPRGKAVGGTSVTNYMLYTRGRPQDWDRIADDGNYGWSYDEVLRYYLKSERANLRRFKNSPYHNRDGELNVEDVPIRTRLSDAFLEAGRIHGIPTVDYNAPEQLGFGYVQVTLNRGHRHSAAKAFLHPHKRRKNLHILSEARATKVIIEPQTKRAYEIEYIKDGVKKTVRCRREVILSAGPIASPQLLMLSGVGPKEHLQSLGIPVIKDLPVGRTLYDHITFPGIIFKLNTTNISLLEQKIATVDNVMQWLHFGDGLLTTTGLAEALGYIKTKISDDPELLPDIEIISIGGSFTSDSGNMIRRAWKLTDEAYSAYAPLNGLDTWSALPMLLQPKSKGFLELRDSNPLSLPIMYSNYLSDQKDMKTMLEAIKFIISLGESEPFQKFGAQLQYPKHRECLHTTPGSDEYWECALRVMVISLHHQIATCKMGPSTDPEAVVDPELRVFGVVGLRVVDSGIIPRPTAAHTNAPAIMIGEKAADMIKNTWANVLSNKV